jgi:hypothetical protein
MILDLGVLMVFQWNQGSRGVRYAGRWGRVVPSRVIPAAVDHRGDGLSKFNRDCYIGKADRSGVEAVRKVLFVPLTTHIKAHLYPTIYYTRLSRSRPASATRTTRIPSGRKDWVGTRTMRRVHF